MMSAFPQADMQRPQSQLLLSALEESFAACSVMISVPPQADVQLPFWLHPSLCPLRDMLLLGLQWIIGCKHARYVCAAEV